MDRKDYRYYAVNIMSQIENVHNKVSPLLYKCVLISGIPDVEQFVSLETLKHDTYQMCLLSTLNDPYPIKVCLDQCYENALQYDISESDMMELLKNNREIWTHYSNWTRKISKHIKIFIQKHPNIKLNSEGQENFIKYIYNAELETINELVHFLINMRRRNLVESHEYWESTIKRMDVLSIFRDRNYNIIEIRYENRRVWEREMNGYVEDDEEYEEELEDVPVTITYKEYKSFVTKVPVRKKSKLPTSCSICLENFKPGYKIHKISCGHLFHPMCLRQQFIKFGPPKCPLCRFDVRETLICPEKKEGTSPNSKTDVIDIVESV